MCALEIYMTLYVVQCHSLRHICTIMLVCNSLNLTAIHIYCTVIRLL